MKKLRIARILFLVFYIICIGVLCYEAATPGGKSGSKSQAVGDFVADVVNGISGDQSKTIYPTEIKINNSKNNVVVGERLNLNASVIPQNTTYSSIIYTSSDEALAKVSSSGEVSFLKSGNVTITATNEYDQSIKMSSNFIVADVVATDISLNLNATLIDDVYCLYLGENYNISYEITPINTTQKEVFYESSNSQIISIDELGNVFPIKDSWDEIVYIKAYTADVEKTIKCKALTPNIIAPIELNCEIAKNSIYVSEKEIINVIYNPLDTTYKNYRIEANNPDIASVVGNTIIGLKEGEASFTVVDERTNLSKSLNITILPRPICESFSITKSSYTLNEGDSLSLSLKNKLPSNCSTDNIKYSILDSSIATISNKGKIKALAEGTTTIYARAYDDETLLYEASASLTITKPLVVEKYADEIAIDSFNLAYNNDYIKDIENDRVEIKLPLGSYDIYDILNKEDFDFSNKPKYNDYSIQIDSNSSDITLKNNTISVTGSGYAMITVTHLSSMLSNVFYVSSLPNFTYSIAETTLKDLKYICEVNKKYTISLALDYADSNIYFDVGSSDVDITQIDYNHFTFTTLNDDKEFSIIVKEKLIDSNEPIVTKTISLDSVFILANNINYYLEGLMENMENATYDIYVGDSYPIISTILPNNTSRYSLAITSSNNDVAAITISTLKALSKGEAVITICDTISGISKSFKVNVSNKIELNDSSKPISFSGPTDSIFIQDNLNNISITMKNKTSAKIKLDLTDSSTFKNVNYEILDTSIADISRDGTITCKKKGSTIIKLQLDDGDVKISYLINLTVKPVEMIQKIESFYTFIRKSLGHYTAYLVLGICATMFYMLLFRRKKYLIGVGVTLASGFLLAMLTEFIQYLTPGRYGCFEDIMLDYYGYLTSGVLIILIYGIIWLVRLRRKMKNQKD